MTENHQYDAWCSQHKCHPMKCFWEHNTHPEGEVATREQNIARTAYAHVLKQEEEHAASTDQQGS
jgi:hypothetical protein